ncbi:hypothetical protein N9B55_00275 [Vicingaceae bacterium]|nr:hypothetical protein [Vicingaceae bacterium]
MAHLLKNENLEIKIDLPLENYNSSRFDWTGKISQVKFKNIPISTYEKLNGWQGSGEGFFNEFGIDTALGFDAVEKGEWFHKIGVGLLKKESASYDFSKTYEVRPAQFNVTLWSDQICIDCVSEDNKGYSYVLKKEIMLTDSGFCIKYYLENTGEKEINTDEYVHNFLAINQESIGENYQLNFPFQLHQKLFGETVNPENKVEIGTDQIQFIDTPKKTFFFSHLNGESSVDSQWQLTNRKNNIAINECGDFQTSKVNLWGDKHVVSPELFIHISLKPGEIKEWSRTYTIESLD